MNNMYFDLTDDQKRLVISQTANKVGLPVQAVEKDLWVTIILQSVFTLPFADKCLFKGGSSLSKMWHLIERFSEDIDLALDMGLLGFEGDLTKKQLKKLRKASSVFVREVFSGELLTAIDHLGLSDECEIIPQSDGIGDNTYPEPRKIHVRYQSLFDDELPYILPEVLLEIGSRSLTEPSAKGHVKSMISENFPIETTLVDSEIRTALPEKTFLEKIFLLHELFTTAGGQRANRKSRHLYDLEKMMDKDFAKSSINDDSLWESIRHHREVFTPINGVDYTLDVRKRICLVPTNDVIEEWMQDYQTMRGSMIYGKALPFNELLDRMHELESRFKNFQNRNE